MVGATMSATNIRNIKGFVRVAPTNEDEARAAAAYLKRKNARTAVVVQDQAVGNLYARTLGAAFKAAFPDGNARRLVAKEPMTFDSSVREAWKNELLYMRGQLCIQKPQYVYFAGRGQHLTHFLSAIANRPCTTTPFTVITGDDTTNLTAQEITQAAAKGVEVFYTGLAHPSMWQKAPEAVSAASAKYFQEGEQLHKWFPNDQRNDGQAIMAHDAVITAAHGIQMAAQWQGKATGDAVARMFHQMGPGQQVAGASGFISFQENGNPVNKVVPILTLNGKGQAVFVEPSFVDGKPPKGD
jgi:ABC-type branched-subunit amino acid transport system substrate-binding protein